MATEFNLAQTDRLLTTTRSVRKRLDLDRQVDRETILACLEIALQAPSGGNSQPWRWMIVQDPDLRKQIAERYRQAHDPYAEVQRRAAHAADDGGVGQRVVSSSQHLSDNLERVPALVIPCLLTRLPADASVADTAGFYGSILPAAWSFMLALRSRGLASAWTTLHLHHEREIAELLGIPETVTQVAMIPVAHHTGDTFHPAARRPVRDIAYLDGWRNPVGE